MSGFSTYLAQKVINHFVRGSTQSATGATYLALFVADPTDNNVTTNELSATWYARQNISSWSAPTGTGSSTSNSNSITFNVVTGSAVTVTHWGIYDASTAGNLLYSGALSSSKTLNVDDVYIVNAGECTLDFQ